ncbi:MAG: outer membrane beta-barrel protein [Gammaproteobacteria bacterium]|nr:outer membrane beta-barrel protein [Gammaproteobacteria bacterium]
MSLLKQLFIFLLVVWMPVTVHAEDLPVKSMQFDVNLMLTKMDAGGNDEFHSSKAVAVHYNYYFKNWLAADIGLITTEKTLDQDRTDVVGTYRASIQTSSILLGLKPRYKFSAPYEVYGRLGLLYWRTELEVEEYFAEGIPGGKVSATDNGSGYYASIGGAHYVTENVIVQLELRHMKQLDVFEGQSNFPFDLTINALSIGVGYRF